MSEGHYHRLNLQSPLSGPSVRFGNISWAQRRGLFSLAVTHKWCHLFLVSNWDAGLRSWVELSKRSEKRTHALQKEIYSSCIRKWVTTSLYMHRFLNSMKHLLCVAEWHGTRLYCVWLFRQISDLKAESSNMKKCEQWDEHAVKKKTRTQCFPPREGLSATLSDFHIRKYLISKTVCLIITCLIIWYQLEPISVKCSRSDTSTLKQVIHTLHAGCRSSIS